ncbi:hypothetical protein FPQ10_12720 [Allobacillus sp. SKP2-8]|uniref:hypothetical protein n=1 Tax=unclassified Allobacillus TaxID=2628859 RepID=UPI001183D4B8|nr:hypothetical protein [Allobacillus sp. SKP2-8]TSJ60720.1 hypothetical protein FPQ10_12720 [Allobacillus sp. SKP2-8]
MMGLAILPLILMVLLAYFLLKRTNRTKRKKSRGKRNVFIYSVILAMSIVVYYVFITQADIEAADVKLHADYQSTLNQLYADPPVSYEKIDAFTLAGRWEYELDEKYESLVVESESDVRIKRREDNEPIIEIGYYRPSTFYIRGIEVPEDNIKYPGVTLLGKELALIIPHDQYSISQTIISKEAFLNHYVGPNQLDDHRLHKLSNFYYQSFQLIVPEDLEVELRGDGLLQEIE